MSQSRSLARRLGGLSWTRCVAEFRLCGCYSGQTHTAPTGVRALRICKTVRTSRIVLSCLDVAPHIKGIDVWRVESQVSSATSTRWRFLVAVAIVNRGFNGGFLQIVDEDFNRGWHLASPHPSWRQSNEEMVKHTLLQDVATGDAVSDATSLIEETPVSKCLSRLLNGDRREGRIQHFLYRSWLLLGYGTLQKASQCGASWHMRDLIR